MQFPGLRVIIRASRHGLSTASASAHHLARVAMSLRLTKDDENTVYAPWGTLSGVPSGSGRLAFRLAIGLRGCVPVYWTSGQVFSTVTKGENKVNANAFRQLPRFSKEPPNTFPNTPMQNVDGKELPRHKGNDDIK